jgi:hypothetical protein
MGTRGGSGQELARQMALKKGREGVKERIAQVGIKDGSNLQRESEQRAVSKGAKSPTGARGKSKV